MLSAIYKKRGKRTTVSEMFAFKSRIRIRHFQYQRAYRRVLRDDGFSKIRQGRPNANGTPAKTNDAAGGRVRALWKDARIYDKGVTMTRRRGRLRFLSFRSISRAIRQTATPLLPRHLAVRTRATARVLFADRFRNVQSVCRTGAHERAMCLSLYGVHGGDRAGRADEGNSRRLRPLRREREVGTGKKGRRAKESRE